MSKMHFWKTVSSIVVIMMVMVSIVHSAKITERLAQEMSSLKRSGQLEVFNVWVMFTDKPKVDNAAYDHAYNSLSDRAKVRRAKMGSTSVTDEDLPVDEGYILQIQQLLHSGASIRRRSKWLNAVSVVDATRVEIEKIAELECVKEVEIVSKFVKSNLHDEVSSKRSLERSAATNLESSFDYGVADQQIKQINAHKLHEIGYNGTGVVVLVLDSGFHFSSHVAFSKLTVIDQYDFVQNDDNVDGDSYDHGTQTLSLIGGMDPGKFYGVGFGAHFLLAKTEDVSSETSVEEDNFVAAIEWGEERGADILSASLGYAYPIYTDKSVFNGNTTISARGVNAAAKRGLICIIAAGNDGPGRSTVSTPGDAFGSITIGSVTSSGSISSFSSRGPTYDGRIKPEVCARGSSAWVVNQNSDVDYRTNSGTSFATPIVAGAVAVLLSVNSSLTPDNVRSALTLTASQSTSPDNSYGWGILNLEAAYHYVDTGICSSRGHSVGGKCDCVDGYTGFNCELEVSCDLTCVNGFCGNDGICTCFKGWKGIKCDIPATSDPTGAGYVLDVRSSIVLSAILIIASMLL